MFDKLGLWDMCSVMSFFSGANVPHPMSVKLGIPLIMSSWSWSRPTNDSLSKLLMGFAFILRYARGMLRISFGMFWNWLPFRYNVWTLNSWENASAGKSDIPVLAKSNTCNLTFFYCIVCYKQKTWSFTWSFVKYCKAISVFWSITDKGLLFNSSISRFVKYWKKFGGKECILLYPNLRILSTGSSFVAGTFGRS